MNEYDWETKIRKERMVKGRRPYYDSFNKDYHCSICWEPYGSYGVRHHTDMNYDEATRFLQGLGCPACEFGNKSHYHFTKEKDRT